MEMAHVNSQLLAASITRAASLQTYLTIRYLVDHELVADAFRSYAYFRWVDDWLDQDQRPWSERMAFLDRQNKLIESCYDGRPMEDPLPEECMLVDLVANDHEERSGLQSYIRNMMAVMAFDADRRNRVVSLAELNAYAHNLAVAVTEALHYFIGHCCPSPHDKTRYLAVTAAHITHMLRDTLDDNAAGYFNIPGEYLKVNRISPHDVASEPYRAWVRSRVRLAREYYHAGKDYLARVPNPRCRLAGYAYTARFEAVLDTIERDDYRLRPDYRECKSMLAGARMSWFTLWSVFNGRNPRPESNALIVR